VILCCEVFSCCRGSPPRPFSGATATGRVAARGDQEPREDTYILNLGQPTTTVEYSLMKFVSALYGGKKHAAKKRHRCATCTIAIRAAGTGWIAPMLRLPLITKGMTISYFRGDAEFSVQTYAVLQGSRFSMGSSSIPSGEGLLKWNRENCRW
jgi:hypothetical protein